MKKWKLYQFGSIIILCILINYFGTWLAAKWNLPLWLDSIGTMLSAYIGGPLVGTLVGVTGNLLNSMAHGANPIYALTSIALAVILGLSARKNTLDTWFGAMAISVIISLVSTIISVPLNILFTDGRTQNIWGDGVIDRLTELGVPKTLSMIAGQFYVDFADKLISMVILFLIINAFRKLISKNNKPAAAEENIDKTVKTLTLSAIVFLSLTSAAKIVSAQPEHSGNVAI